MGGVCKGECGHAGKLVRVGYTTLTAREDNLLCKAGESLLWAMEAAGIRAPSHCRSGECGWCHSKLVTGDVYVPADADGRRLADVKFNWIHPCVSYPLSDVEICVFPICE